jgi:hypothetical protein
MIAWITMIRRAKVIARQQLSTIIEMGRIRHHERTADQKSTKGAKTGGDNC